LICLLVCGWTAFAGAIDTPANPVTAVGFHPATGQIVAGGYGEVLVWDAPKPSSIPNAAVKLSPDRRIAGLIGRVRGLAFSKDGARLAVAEGEPGRGGAIRLLDFATGHVLFTLDQEKDECFAVAFSPDSKLLAGGAPDGTVRVWNTADGKLVTTLREQAGWITGIAFSPNGKLLAASSADKTAQVWVTDGWKPLTKIPENLTAPVNGVAFSPDSTLLVLALGGADDAERAIRIWRTENVDEPKNMTAQQATRRATLLKQTRPVDIGPGIPTGLAFSAPGAGSKQVRLFVPLTDKTIKVLNQNGGVLTTLPGDTDWVDSVAVNADGSLVASGSASGAVLVWNGISGKLLATLR
jgi:WD40 repeat protein